MRGSCPLESLTFDNHDLVLGTKAANPALKRFYSSWPAVLESSSIVVRVKRSLSQPANRDVADLMKICFTSYVKRRTENLFQAMFQFFTMSSIIVIAGQIPVD